MKIISNKEYNELKGIQRAYLNLLMKPLQGVFEKVTDDDLLRENALVYAENKKLHSIIKEVREELNKIDSATYQGDTDKKTYYKYEQTRIQKILEILDKET